MKGNGLESKTYTLSRIVKSNKVTGITSQFPVINTVRSNKAKILARLLRNGKMMMGYGAPKHVLNGDQNIIVLEDSRIISEDTKLRLWRDPQNTTKVVTVKTNGTPHNLDIGKFPKTIPNMELTDGKALVLISNPKHMLVSNSGDTQEAPNMHSFLLLEISKSKSSPDALLKLLGRVVLVRDLQTDSQINEVLALHKKRTCWVGKGKDGVMCMIYAHLSSAF